MQGVAGGSARRPATAIAGQALSDGFVHSRPPRPVDRCSIHDRRRLLEDYVLADRPVVVPDAGEAWPAMRRWTPQFFLDHYAAVTRPAGGRDWSLGDYVAQMLRGDRPAPLPYPYSYDMRRSFPELIADVEPQPVFGRIDRQRHPLLWKNLLNATRPHELFFAGAGAVFRPLHYDALMLHGHITQIFGDKEFFLYPPDETDSVYPVGGASKASLIDDPAAPDLARFPRFAWAEHHRVLLRQGETIFFPARWWHYTRIPTPSISYGGTGLTASNWDAFIRDNCASRLAAGVPWSKTRLLLAYGVVAGAAMNLHERWGSHR